ncbi:MAG: hypothetical protein ABIQ30_10100 [Devosia sp.]
MGSEKIEFSTDGIRIALVKEDGKLEDLQHVDLAMFGGVLPNVGDRIVTLWPDKPEFHPEDHMRVLARYYVGEFAGDNCWWLLCAYELPTSRDMQLYRLAKKASVETRKDNAARAKHHQENYDSLVKIREKLTPRKTPTTKRRGRRPLAKRPPGTLPPQTD